MTDIDSIHSCGYHCEIPACMKVQRTELLARLDTAEKDVARYRWLRGQELHDPVIYIGVDGIDFKNRWALGAGDETKTDAAIDEAMKGKP